MRSKLLCLRYNQVTSFAFCVRIVRFRKLFWFHGEENREDEGRFGPYIGDKDIVVL